MLKISTKGRYAARIVVYLATTANPAQPARTQDIAKAEDISPGYVEQILMKLKTAGIVKSHRGISGGFSLAGDPKTITLAAILLATEGPLAIVPCAAQQCRRTAFCVTRGVWEKAAAALSQIFTETTVAELAQQARQLRTAKSLQFEI